MQLYSLLFPAPAGMIPGPLFTLAVFVTFPRTRGDDPLTFSTATRRSGFSPHPRG